MTTSLEKKSEIELVLRSFKSTFFTVGAFSAIINLLLLAPSLYMLQVYDRVLASRNEVTLLMLTLLIVGAYLFMGGLELVRSYVLVRIGAQFDLRLGQRVYTAAFEQNLKQAGGNAGQALADLTSIRQADVDAAATLLALVRSSTSSVDSLLTFLLRRSLSLSLSLSPFPFSLFFAVVL